MVRLVPSLGDAEELALERLRRGPVTVRELSSDLGLPEDRVRRLLEGLRSWGLPVAEDPDGRYSIVALDEISRVNELLVLLNLKARVLYLEYCERSSQDLARGLAEKGAGEWTVVVCEEMAGGRGRLGRPWLAPRGGLWFTVILRPGTGFRAPPSLLTLAAGVAVAESVRALTGVRADLKWPNDVLVEGRKLCGILAEGSFEEASRGLVLLGIGLNANNRPPLEGAVSLKETLGREVPRATALAVTLARLRHYYHLLSEGKGEKVVGAWVSFSSTIGREVRVVLLDGSEVTGMALGVDELGRLMVESRGRVRLVEAGDVHHLHR